MPAIVEQLFAELIDGPLAHLPSGQLQRQQRLLTCLGMAHNLTRAVAPTSAWPGPRQNHPPPDQHRAGAVPLFGLD